MKTSSTTTKQKGRYYLKHLIFPELPPFRTRSEEEMKQILHKVKVIAFKRRLEDEISHPIEIFSLPQYQDTTRRRDFFRFIISNVRQLLP